MSKSTKYWFKPKRYGYGFYPISVEGWTSILIFLGLISLAGYIDGIYSETMQLKYGLRFFLDMFILITIHFSISKDKVQGEIKWRWGNEPE